MILGTAISQLVTALEALSWTSADGTGTTTFQEVFDFQNYGHTEGFPFACVYETSGVGRSLTNRDIEFDTEVTVDICVNWSVIEKSDETAQMQEANLRLREAWDYVKTKLFDINFIASPDIVINPTFVRMELEDINIYLYRVTFNIKESIDRG